MCCADQLNPQSEAVVRSLLSPRAERPTRAWPNLRRTDNLPVSVARRDLGAFGGVPGLDPRSSQRVTKPEVKVQKGLGPRLEEIARHGPILHQQQRSEQSPSDRLPRRG